MQVGIGFRSDFFKGRVDDSLSNFYSTLSVNKFHFSEKLYGKLLEFI